MKILLFILVLIASPLVHADNFISLATGEQKLIPIKEAAQFIVTNPKSIKIVISSKGINVIGKQPGRAEATSGKKHFRFIVYSTKVADLKSEMGQWVHPIYDLKLSEEPNTLVVKGRIHRLSDWIQLQKFKKENAKILRVEANPSSALLPVIQENVGRALQERAFFSAKSLIRNNHIELLTYTKNKEEKAALQELAEDWGAVIPPPSQAVELRPMVEIDVVIAEIKKNSLETLGLQLPGSYSTTILPAGDLSAASNTFNAMTPQLNAVFSNQMNRVLANPKLLCRSGEAAHFVAGGEIPIKMMSWKTADVVWKRYGVILDITPVADLNQNISTQLVTEISLLDDAHKVEGIPALLTNRIETHFDLHGSKTIALSGLIKSELGRGETGTPLLGQIPIIGELFKSRDYKEFRTELVIFVTPRVILPDNPPVVKLPSNFWGDSLMDSKSNDNF